MKTKLLAGATVLALGTASNVSAITIDITEMLIQGLEEHSFTMTGTFDSASSGDIVSGEFFHDTWTMTTLLSFDIGSEVAAYSIDSIFYPADYYYTLTGNQMAWGAFVDWGTHSSIPLLIIMDCGLANPGNICTGVSEPMQNGPLPGETLIFSGSVSAVPVPAAVWLFGSGLIGLIGVAKRKAHS